MVSEQAADQLHRPEVWSSAAAGYDDAIAPIMRPYAATTLDLLGLTGGTARPRLLDVAAGTGVVALEAARRGAEVVATDFAPGMVEVMRRRFAAEGLNARAEVMDGQALGLEDESFDLGTSTFGLIFFPDPLVGLRELRRVLRPGGAAGIASWDLARSGCSNWLAPRLPAQFLISLPPAAAVGASVRGGGPRASSAGGGLRRRSRARGDPSLAIARPCAVLPPPARLDSSAAAAVRQPARRGDRPCGRRIR